MVVYRSNITSGLIPDHSFSRLWTRDVVARDVLARTKLVYKVSKISGCIGPGSQEPNVKYCSGIAGADMLGCSLTYFNVVLLVTVE